MFRASRPGLRGVAGAVIVTVALGLAAPALAFDSGGSGGGGSSGGGGGGSASSSNGDGGSSAVSTVTLADARTHIKRQRYRQAVATLRQILAADPNNADALNLMGYSLRKSGDYKNAQGFYLKALKISPRHRDANEYLGELYVEIGQLAKARERLRALEAICGTGCEQYRELKQSIDRAS